MLKRLGGIQQRQTSADAEKTDGQLKGMMHKLIDYLESPLRQPLGSLLRAIPDGFREQLCVE